jgi:N-acetylmuramoyl-L-alanine amidase
MKIYIDIGHGEGGDPGAVSKPYIEHEMAMVTGLAMADQFHKRGIEVQVEPGNLTISESARRANLWNADLLLSIHYNAGGGDRGEVIYSWKRGSEALASIISIGLKTAGQTVVRAYKSKANSKGDAEYFGILRIARMPAVIIEPAFIDNVVDRQLVDTLLKQKQMGITLANAIADAYGLEDDDEVAAETKIKVNGQVLTGYILKDNLSYAPVRALAEALGAKVEWDDKTKTVNITKEERT